MEQETNVEEEVLEVNDLQDDTGTNPEEGGEESEVETSSDLETDAGSGDEGGESNQKGSEASKIRAKAQIERLKEENRKLKEENRKAQKGEQVGSSNTDMMAKAFLAASFDIKEPDAQEEAIRLADKFDITVDELMNDSDYKEKVSNLQTKIVQKRKVVASTGGAAQRQKGAEYYAKYFQKHQSFPDGVSLKVKNEAVDLLTEKPKQAWER